MNENDEKKTEPTVPDPHSDPTAHIWLEHRENCDAHKNGLPCLWDPMDDGRPWPGGYKGVL